MMFELTDEQKWALQILPRDGSWKKLDEDDRRNAVLLAAQMSDYSLIEVCFSDGSVNEFRLTERGCAMRHALLCERNGAQ